jgi:hypothetical protein
MLTSIVVATAFVIGTFFERIVFAVFVLVMARATVRALRRARAKAQVLAAPYVLRGRMIVGRWKQRLRYVFGPTVTVAA